MVSKSIENEYQLGGRGIRYYGGKGKLIPFILETLAEFGMTNESSVLDAFSGTSIVSQAFKRFGAKTIANDNLYFCFALASAHLTTNKRPTFRKLNLDIPVIEHLNSLKPKAGFVTKNYSPYRGCNRMYLTPQNAGKIDAIREQIHEWKTHNLISKNEELYLIALLILGVNLISNVTGTYGAYLKFWEGRALKPLTLTDIQPVSNAHKNQAFNLDAVRAVSKQRFDFIYLDPPYNSRGYFSNYFLLEVIALGWFEKEPKLTGVTGIPKELTVSSKFSSKREVESGFRELLDSCAADVVALSYNNEGLLNSDKLNNLISDFGVVTMVDKSHRRYKSINQSSGQQSTKEMLFILEKS
jgi:adenine-specific DNA-methyltransferase